MCQIQMTGHLLLLCLLSVGCASTQIQPTAAKLECEALVHRYAIYRDELNAAEVGALFTNDAKLEIRGQVFEGRRAIEERIINTPASPMSRHLMHSVLIRLDGPSRATGVSYATVYLAPIPTEVPAGTPAKVSGFAAMGEYHDEFVRTAEGWRISSRRFIAKLESATP